MLLGRFKHTAGARKRWTVDYSQWLPLGVTLASSTVEMITEDVDAFVDDVTISGNKVFFYLNDGEVNETFIVSVQTVNTRTEIKNDTVEFFVVAA